MNLTPRATVKELDKYIVGQDEAKRAVAIALRNRYRRSKLTEEQRAEITPKNIIMKGPTGVGKTEIARRLAKLVGAPFIKVEATKYTEVGYVGRDVESMIRDLVEASVRMVKEEQFATVSAKAGRIAEKRVLKVLEEALADKKGETPKDIWENQLLTDLRAGKYDISIEIEVNDEIKPLELNGMQAEISLGSIFGDIMPKRKKKRRITVKEAMQIIVAEESDKLIDDDAVKSEGVRRAEEEGIIFIDEIDKIANRAKQGGGQDVSREGVQRDILPIVEGCSVTTKYGIVKTDYILFIAAGAFHVSAVEDLIPELQGRFPIKVELKSLTREDFVNILNSTENSIIKQYTTLLAVDNVDLCFTDDAIERIAELAAEINATSEDIGARRLHTVMENLVEDVSFNAGDDIPLTKVTIDKRYVDEHLSSVIEKQSVAKYIL